MWAEVWEQKDSTQPWLQHSTFGKLSDLAGSRFTIYFLSKDRASVRICKGVNWESADHRPWHALAAICSGCPFPAPPSSQAPIPSTAEPDLIKTAVCFHDKADVGIIRMNSLVLTSHHFSVLCPAVTLCSTWSSPCCLLCQWGLFLLVAWLGLPAAAVLASYPALLLNPTHSPPPNNFFHLLCPDVALQACAYCSL